MIEVHRVDVMAPPGGGLSEEELERAARYRVDAARRSFVAVRSALRRVLGERLGVAPADVVIAEDEHRRPCVEGVAFSVSHSGALGLIAVADAGRRVGVDVEQVRPRTDFAALAARFFHPDEVAAIGERRDAFFRCWTRKEAVVKALGLGLAHPLESFAVDPDAEGPQPVRGVDGLWVAELAIDEGYVAALATDSGDPPASAPTSSAIEPAPRSRTVAASSRLIRAGQPGPP